MRHNGGRMSLIAATGATILVLLLAINSVPSASAQSSLCAKYTSCRYTYYFLVARMLYCSLITNGYWWCCDHHCVCGSSCVSTNEWICGWCRTSQKCGDNTCLYSKIAYWSSDCPPEAWAMGVMIPVGTWRYRIHLLYLIKLIDHYLSKCHIVCVIWFVSAQIIPAFLIACWICITYSAKRPDPSEIRVRNLFLSRVGVSIRFICFLFPTQIA
jgi:hypothetical protein